MNDENKIVVVSIRKTRPPRADWVVKIQANGVFCHYNSLHYRSLSQVKTMLTAFMVEMGDGYELEATLFVDWTLTNKIKLEDDSDWAIALMTYAPDFYNI